MKGNFLEILFENEDLLAINKPEGLPAIPERQPGRENLLALMQKEYNCKLYIVHRLDKDVSGVMLFAKNAVAHRLLNDQFSAHTVRKTYLALVHGNPEADQGHIDQPIRQFGSGRMGVDAQRGKASLTEYRALERFEKFTLLELCPKTGRRHQLRVHLYFIGRPIAGDPLYGDAAIRKLFPRMLLHAHTIEFEDGQGRSLSIEAPLPSSFKDILAALKPSAGEEKL